MIKTPFETKKSHKTIYISYSPIASNLKKSHLISYAYSDENNIYIEYSDDTDLCNKYGEINDKDVLIHDLFLNLFDNETQVIFSGHDKGWFIFGTPSCHIVLDTETKTIEIYPDSDDTKMQISPLLLNTISQFVTLLGWEENNVD